MFPLHDNIPTRRFPIVNNLLILLNLLVFVKELQLAHLGVLDPFMRSFALLPARFIADPVAHFYTIVTAMFLHGGWGHVIGNMWFLYIFGDNVEDNLGHLRYLAYYLLMGIAAALAQVALNPNSVIPMMGASGAIAGILGSYIVLYPHARVTTFFVLIFFVRLIEVPAFLFLGYWFLIQAVNSAGALTATAQHGDIGGVAWWAHAGGFLAGFIGIPFFRRRR